MPKRPTHAKRKGQSRRARTAQIPVDRSRDLDLRTGGKWDPAKVMDYVCDRISDGRLLTDTLRRAKIPGSEWWKIWNSTDEYKNRYLLARKDQARVTADHAKAIANGTDPQSRKFRKRFRKYLARFAKKNDPYLLEKINTLEKIIANRNRLQLDAAKWMAKVTDPDQYGEKSTTNIGVLPGQNGSLLALSVTFVDPLDESDDEKSGESLLDGSAE